LAKVLELVSCLLFGGVISESSDELFLQFCEGKPSRCRVANSGFYRQLCPQACTSSSHVRQDGEGADFIVSEFCGVNGEVDLDGQHPFIELGGSPIENQGLRYEDNFAGVWVWECGWNWWRGSHDGGLGSSISGGVPVRMKGMTVNDYSELSSDPLLI
jgi:hypothetical protein